MSKRFLDEYKMCLKKKEFTKEGRKYTYVIYVRRVGTDNFVFVKECNAVSHSEYTKDKALCK